jgi:hypothetical protein
MLSDRLVADLKWAVQMWLCDVGGGVCRELEDDAMVEKSRDNEERGEVGGEVRFTQELVVGRWRFGRCKRSSLNRR